MTTDDSNGGMSRRRFVRDAGLVTVAAAGLGARPADATPRRSVRKRSTVAVFGGGIAGLTAAHELAERGFDVSIYESRAWGGKARSTSVPGTASGGRLPLPGEHGWRIFFGFYQNTVDTMRRIPFGSNDHGVFDNLVAAPQLDFARAGGPDLVLPLGQLDPRPYTPSQVIELLVAEGVRQGLPPQDLTRFVGRIAVYASSCRDRRIGEWENVSWHDFTQADQCSESFRRIAINALSHFIQASKAPNTSAAFSAEVFELVLYSLLGRGANGPTIRVLNAPTNTAFLDPWLSVLDGLGVSLNLGHELAAWTVSDNQVTGAAVNTPHNGRTVVKADWYVCALPVERARVLWNSDVLRADPSLAGMNRLSTGWMNGLKFYLREPRPLVKGHVYCTDSPWQVGCISQSQFWPADFAATYGDGRVRETLSVIISDWDMPGIVYGKPARDCTASEIAREAWAQLKSHLNDTATGTLTDDLILGWNIDPGMTTTSGGHLESQDPLVLPAVNERRYRPDVTTAIGNLFLAGDYLRSDWLVANMEAASFNARRAANAILAAAGSTGSPAAAIPPYEPAEWAALQRIDQLRYNTGQPNLLDHKLTLSQLTQRLQLTSTIRPLLQR